MIFKILFALIYTVGYFLSALFSTGGGHGNFYLLSPTVPWIFIIAAIMLFGKLNNLTTRIIFITVMTTHYILLTMFLTNYNFVDDKGWTRHSIPIVPVIWYLTGQIIIWLLFFDEIIKRKNTG